jgi:hypothetical protein
MDDGRNDPGPEHARRAEIADLWRRYEASRLVSNVVSQI